jgi:hypothetical protein
MIDETPIIDPHAYLRCDQPHAPDLAGPMSCQWIQTELRVIGMPAADLDPALPADERVRRSLPSPRRIRNTAMAWCLHRIFRDHCDFDEPHLIESNDRDLAGLGTGA